MENCVVLPENCVWLCMCGEASEHRKMRVRSIGSGPGTPLRHHCVPYRPGRAHGPDTTKKEKWSCNMRLIFEDAGSVNRELITAQREKGKESERRKNEKTEGVAGGWRAGFARADLLGRARRARVNDKEIRSGLVLSPFTFLYASSFWLYLAVIWVTILGSICTCIVCTEKWRKQRRESCGREEKTSLCQRPISDLTEWSESREGRGFTRGCTSKDPGVRRPLFVTVKTAKATHPFLGIKNKGERVAYHAKKIAHRRQWTVEDGRWKMCNYIVGGEYSSHF